MIKQIKKILVPSFIVLISLFVVNNTYAVTDSGDLGDAVEGVQCLQYTIQETRRTYNTDNVSTENPDTPAESTQYFNYLTPRICVPHVQDGKFTTTGGGTLKTFNADEAYNFESLINDNLVVGRENASEGGFVRWKSSNDPACYIKIGGEWSEFESCVKDQLIRAKVPSQATTRNDGKTVTHHYEFVDDVLTAGQDDSKSDASEPTGSDGTTGSAADGQTTCYNSGGAMSLGWIACPLLDWLGNAAQDVYNDMVKPSLEVSPKLFSENQDQGTYKAWNVFQNFANVAFVIMLLVVIFSQLTGIGIDNYGVKKILPKLIVVAILVNLSYYICLICVDLSNIVGNAIQNLFSSIDVGEVAINIDASQATTAAGEALSSVDLSGTLTSVGIIAALVVAVGAIWANPAIVLSLLVAGLGVIISILFLFILLAAREAAIVVMVVISPLAFICYALPNTKSLFDKWIKIGEGLLLVYPIAGLLVGGGDFVSRLLLSSGFATQGFPAALTAMVVGIAPIFFIPTVLRSSFSALGSLGAKISGAGSKLSGYATGKARGSEFYKTAQQMGLERKHRLNAGVNKEGKETKLGSLRSRYANSAVGRLTGANRRLDAARQASLKDLEKRGGNRDLSKKENWDRALAHQQHKADEAEIEAQMTDISNNPLYDDVNAMAADLTTELSKSEDQQDKTRISALSRTLFTKQAAGFKALESVFDSGDIKWGENTRGLLNSILANGDIKAKDRTLYGVAGDLLKAGNAGTFDSAYGQDVVGKARGDRTYLKGLKGQEYTTLADDDFNAVATFQGSATDDGVWAADVRQELLTNDQLRHSISPEQVSYLANAQAATVYRDMQTANAMPHGTPSEVASRNRAISRSSAQASSLYGNEQTASYVSDSVRQSTANARADNIASQYQDAVNMPHTNDAEIEQRNQAIQEAGQEAYALKNSTSYNHLDASNADRIDNIVKDSGYQTPEQQQYQSTINAQTMNQFQSWANTAQRSGTLGEYKAPANFDYDIGSGTYKFHDQPHITFDPRSGTITDNSTSTPRIIVKPQH